MYDRRFDWLPSVTAYVTAAELPMASPGGIHDWRTGRKEEGMGPGTKESVGCLHELEGKGWHGKAVAGTGSQSMSAEQSRGGFQMEADGMCEPLACLCRLQSITAVGRSTYLHL